MDSESDDFALVNLSPEASPSPSSVSESSPSSSESFPVPTSPQESTEVSTFKLPSSLPKLNSGEFVELSSCGKELRVLNMYTGEVLRVLDYDPSRCSGVVSVSYSPELAQLIFNLLLGGRSLSELVKMPGMPSLSQLARWRAYDPEFDKLFTQARELRAELLYDEVLESSRPEGLSSSESLAEKKLYLDSLKWVVERGNRDKFSASSKSSEALGQVIIQVNTGIDRGD